MIDASPMSAIALSLAAGLTLAVCLAFPISNPDVFWHLSAASRIFELKSIPAEEWLSFTRAGAPWMDFEWLTQVIYGAAYRAGGMAGLWVLKNLLLLGAAGALWSTLRLHDSPAPYRRAAIALWSVGSLTRSDIRPELFSVLGFGLLFLELESRRLKWAPRHPAAPLVFFCLWANLHAGFAYGLLLIGFYAVGDKRYLRYLLPAFLGTLVNPFGPSLYKLFWEFWSQLGDMSRYLTELSSAKLGNPWHWPHWLALVIGWGAAFWRFRANGSVALGPAAALLYYGLSATRHFRFTAYYITLAIPLAAHLLPRNPGRLMRWLSGGVTCASLAFALTCAVGFGAFTRVFNDRFVSVEAADFLEGEKLLAGRRLYHPWSWGGYLGWRLYPKFRVFQDGRYNVFAGLLDEAQRGLSSPSAWREFLERHKIEVALLESGPYAAHFMPEEQWTAVYQDRKAMVFVRRGLIGAP